MQEHSSAICAYAVLSNHYHLVLHVDQARARQWNAHEVIERWSILFSRPPLIQRWQQGLCGQAECEIAEQIVELWRRRLCDVSWYMRCLNEHLARRANAEDNCTGRFWAGFRSMQNRHSLHPCRSEGRFKSQALLDEAGLLTAMAYVDLNPIRADIASTPEESEFTSIYARIKALKRSGAQKSTTASSLDSVPVATALPLLGFIDENVDRRAAIPFSLRDYLALVDWTGRARRKDKRGAIDERLPAIMLRLNLDAGAWRLAMQPRGNVFGRALGQLDHMRLHARTLGQSWVRGLQQAERMYRNA